MPVTIGAVAAHFGRDLERGVAKVRRIVADARAIGCEVLVLPGSAIGGYLGDLVDPRADRSPGLPPPLAEDAAELRAVITAAGPLVVCIGYAEAAPDGRVHNAAVCVSGDGVLGRHRKVHLPAGEHRAYAPGDGFAAFDTPVGRFGMLVDYDKTFPEASRALALDGARLVACLSAWPASVTDRASRLPQDRQSRLFDLYDCARAAENQVVWASSNQTGTLGGLRFLGQAKLVGPGGDVLARTSSKGGLALADVDVDAEIERARRVLHHLEELAAAIYAHHGRADGR